MDRVLTPFELVVCALAVVGGITVVALVCAMLGLSPT